MTEETVVYAPSNRRSALRGRGSGRTAFFDRMGWELAVGCRTAECCEFWVYGAVFPIGFVGCVSVTAFLGRRGLPILIAVTSPVRMGDGLCCVFRVHNPERLEAHRYAFVDEMQARTLPIADECGSDVVRLRVASYDPKPYFNPNAVPYLHCKPNRYAAPRKIKRPMTAKAEEKAKQRCYLLIDIICEKKKDITRGRKIWIGIGQALAGLFGDVEGRRLFHLVSQWHPDYYHTECESMFEWCMRRHSEVDIATFFYHCRVHGITFK